MLCSLQAAEEGPGWLGLGLFSASRCRSRPNPLIFIGCGSGSLTSEESCLQDDHLSQPCRPCPVAELEFQGRTLPGLSASQPTAHAPWFPAATPEAAPSHPQAPEWHGGLWVLNEPKVCFNRVR